MATLGFDKPGAAIRLDAGAFFSLKMAIFVPQIADVLHAQLGQNDSKTDKLRKVAANCIPETRLSC